MAGLTGAVTGVVAGVVTGAVSADQVIHVGAFAVARIHGQPVAWTVLTGPGLFRLTLPPGRWYLHAVAGWRDRHGFLCPEAWGSYGGIYGFGLPVEAGPHPAGPPPAGPLPPTGPLVIHLSPLWRDLTHVPHHRQPALPDDQWRVVHAVIDALREDLTRSVDGELDRIAGLTRTRLSAVFKRATGLPVAEYRTRLRLESAKALLVQTNYDVLRVALEVGYSTAAQLGRMFDRYPGVSPGEFRRLARQAAAYTPGDATGPDAMAAFSGQPPNRHPSPLFGRQTTAIRRPPGGAGVVGTLVRAGRWTAGLAGLSLRHLGSVSPSGAVIRGQVSYQGTEKGTVLYVAAFPGPYPDTYPAAWCALPGPGPFTLRSVPPGRHFLLACYCRRRMLYPGDFHTAFAYGGYGDLDRTGADPWNPIPLTVAAGEVLEGITLELVDGDRAAGYARPWRDTFLPDGR